MPETNPPRQSSPARVTVLLATFNGERWLGEQLDTILSQEGVDLRVVVRDDLSTDATPAILADYAARDPRLTVLESTTATGSAAANFYRLLAEVDLESAGAIAFSDQDDIWLPGKLARHAELLAAGNDGVSSDVTAFGADGTRTLVRKSYPQRAFDYLLESPGPGSTFLLTPRLAALVRDLVTTPDSTASAADFHDWLVYAVCRARGWNWHIDDVPSVDYRQHDSNSMGANVGAASARSRLTLIRERWHRGQAALLAGIALEVAPSATRPELRTMRELIAGGGIRNRLRLARRSGQLRRRPRDRAIIGVLIALGVW